MELEFLTAREAAALLRVSIHTLRKWRTTGQGPGWTRIGKCIKYNRASLERWLQGREQKENEEKDGVYCSAEACAHNETHRCLIRRHDMISIDENGRCENFVE